jgi:hypothetical protein
MAKQTVIKNEGLVKAFKRYQERYFVMDKKSKYCQISSGSPF